MISLFPCLRSENTKYVFLFLYGQWNTELMGLSCFVVTSQTSLAFQVAWTCRNLGYCATHGCELSDESVNWPVLGIGEFACVVDWPHCSIDLRGNSRVSVQQTWVAFFLCLCARCGVCHWHYSWNLRAYENLATLSRVLVKARNVFCVNAMGSMHLDPQHLQYTERS